MERPLFHLRVEWGRHRTGVRSLTSLGLCLPYSLVCKVSKLFGARAVCNYAHVWCPAQLGLLGATKI